MRSHNKAVLKSAALFGLGMLAGIAVCLLWWKATPEKSGTTGREQPVATSLCYSCFWEGYEPKLRNDLIAFYLQYRNPDPFVTADVGYILWRATGNPNCDARFGYRRVTQSDTQPYRRFLAQAALGFSAAECHQDGSTDLIEAAKLASEIGLATEADLLTKISTGELRPNVTPTAIETSMPVPAGATSFVLGESKIEITAGTRIGAQVDRVTRDWMSYQLKWDMSDAPLVPDRILNYHEGAVVKEVVDLVPAHAFALSGSVAARIGGQWYAPDDRGEFRFLVLNDKLLYPTSHATGEFAWLQDTHGISALVPQAIERKMDVVIGCGDAEGKVKAAYYLAQRGMNVVFPGDRFADLLLGYKGKGVLMGTAPVKKVDVKIFIGNQPVTFSLAELITVEDTKENFPIQYYDAGARYFKKFASMVPLKLDYVLVTEADQIDKVLQRARQIKSNAVAVRVMTAREDKDLRVWLAADARHRAILFHSGLYPFAQKLFRDFPKQVTFGDLRPVFK